MVVQGEKVAEKNKKPEFTDVVVNQTVVAGREAVLSCHVSHLGSYKVVMGWSMCWRGVLVVMVLQ